ncbi:hypothetical protein A3E17_01570 [Candidatus Amesbacteria bacterium RIFCSPHIGHO2_12_FULL_48_14]|uniref:DUF2330 domain-containing protein n=1 Tax=Candidatus Amesbacteria bacterium RIFCSPHIGHO2_12_FULL_48_14 TaxID=1797257 RepID=A0A1F4ZB48_9BACT|nr:MAG: hypothetical protein A2V48_02635 [Candidatus Amesbacteria bacterium RBG_19FT_COMBO_48_16]OGC99156.1 MAG: hypothetical protein A2W16_03610 [Candidatus Amesbacteria bacterium RBG_16_48_31]OGD00410.1 MAG: hypothetical protein A2702_02295 [Candidatus Amesbacteria bacterium RIFCSPHIGHO2_01_FULL_48_75]OGD03435.1 MAG: hypothetical protein A3E17_01570 [Candidatus Amesbacteria bacterium RIFCSPHIGHO2_12_FULL_48_14]OGD07637.1 MAG: hypothetical protein A3B58_03410 [Candidatus Amesbacteria bacterium
MSLRGMTVLAAAAVVMAIGAGRAAADGMVIPMPQYWVEETGQKAVIWHEAGKETLIISPVFRGNTREFAWVIPVPARPEVEASRDEVFTALDDFTRPKYPDRYPIPLGIGKGMISEDYEAQVTVVETKRVDIYDIAVLEAQEGRALREWLRENGYEYPTNKDYLLQYYVNKDWFFVAAKVNTEALGYAGSGLREGHATPLEISFSSNQIIYPLRISGPGATQVTPAVRMAPTVAVDTEELIVEPKPMPGYPRGWGTDGWVNLVLYVFSDHKKYVPGFNTEYAGSVQAKTIERMSVDEEGKPWMTASKKMYLTKLTRQMSAAQMNEDLVLRDAADNRAVGGVSPWLDSPVRVALILGGPIALELVVVGYIWYSYSKRRRG